MRRTPDGTRAAISRITDSASLRLTLPLKWAWSTGMMLSPPLSTEPPCCTASQPDPACVNTGGPGWSEHLAQQAEGVAAEDLVDVADWEAAVVQSAGEVVELVVAGQDGLVVAVQVGAEGYVVRACRLGEPEDLGPEVVHRAAGEAAGPAAGQAARFGDRGRVPGGHQPGVVVLMVVAGLAVRDDHRLAGRVEHGHGAVERGVRAVDHDAQPVALGHHVTAEPAQATVHRRLGL